MGQEERKGPAAPSSNQWTRRQSATARVAVAATIAAAVAVFTVALRLSSGGSSTMRPSSGIDFSSMLKPGPSLWGKTASMRIQESPFLPLPASYSSTL